MQQILFRICAKLSFCKKAVPLRIMHDLDFANKPCRILTDLHLFVKHCSLHPERLGGWFCNPYVHCAVGSEPCYVGSMLPRHGAFLDSGWRK
jgi:hypothetical protein